jgi:hypothetical protein
MTRPVTNLAASIRDRLGERAGQPASLVEFFRGAPTGGASLDLPRKHDSTRIIKW